MITSAVWHVAGGYDPAYGQLCSRCGELLKTSALVPALHVPTGWMVGERVLMMRSGPHRMLASEESLKPARDRSDEVDCVPVYNRANG